MTSLLPVIESVDNFRITDLDSQFVPFYLSLDSATSRDIIGYVRLDVLEQIRAHDSTTLVVKTSDGSSAPTAVGFASTLNTSSLRSDAIQNLAVRLRDAGLFPSAIGGRKWRDERYTIYAHPFKSIGVDSNVAFNIERSACELFGLVRYGVHTTMYLPDYRIWIPRRSKTKPTYPGMLDNSVAGGIAHDMTPFQSMIKECEEEAGLSEAVLKENLKAVGAVSYFFQNARGNLQPEVGYMYELLCPTADDPSYIPKPVDDEVESFELMPWQEVKDRMLAGEFKSNSALVLVDFLIRHGKITPENEPNYLEIVTRTHGRFGFGG